MKILQLTIFIVYFGFVMVHPPIENIQSYKKSLEIGVSKGQKNFTNMKDELQTAQITKMKTTISLTVPNLAKKRETNNPAAENSNTITSQKILPIGLNTVEDCNTYNAIYVDKTGFALKLLQKRGCYLFLRPRRFGKTFFLNTLESILLGKKDVFKDYVIGNPQNGYDWEVYRVIRLTFVVQDPINALTKTLVEIAKCYRVDKMLADIEKTDTLRYFEKLLRELSPIDKNRELKPGNTPPLALLIDEYDLPFRNSDNTIREYFHKVFTLFKELADERIVRFAFFTGCNKINLLADYKNTNHFGLTTTLGIEDISLNPQYSAICGFTKKEIETYFHNYMQEAAGIHEVIVDVIYKEVEYWYDGYRFTQNSTLLYNPISLIYYLRDKDIRNPQNYWIETVNHPKTVMEALIEARLRSKSIILNLKKCYTRHELFQSTENIHSMKQEAGPGINLKQISFESILFQNGYLTIQEYDYTNNLYTLEVPNNEVMDAFINGIQLAMEKEDECMTLHRDAKSSLQDLNINLLVQTFNTFLERYLHLVETNTKEKEVFLKGFLQNLLTLDPASRNWPTPEWDIWTRKLSGEFLIETSKYRIIIEGKYEATSIQMEEAYEQAKNYQFPYSKSKNNRALVRLVFNFNGNGVFQWIGDEYDADNKFVRMLDQDRNIHSKKRFSCDFPNCTKSYDKPKSLSNHMRVHRTNAQGEQ